MRFLGATGISFYGDWLTTVALVVVLYQVTGNVSAPVGYIVVRSVARVLGPWPGGHLADRWEPSLVAACCSAIQGILTVALIFAVGRHAIPAVYALVLAAQFLGAAARPCYGAIIPGLVERDRLTFANAFFGAEYASSIFIAPAIGAVLLQHTGFRPLLVLDAVSFFIAAGLLVTLPSADAGQRRTSHAGTGAGVRVVLQDATLRAVAAAYLGGALVITAVQGVLVVVAAHRFGGAASVGWLYSAVGAGGLLGSWLAARHQPLRVGMGAVVIASMVEVIALAVFAATAIFSAALVLLLLSSLAGVLYQTWGAVELQTRTAPRLLGRVNAVIVGAMYTGMLAGSIAALLLAPRVGWQSAVIYVAGAALVILGLAMTVRVPAPRASAPVAT